MSLVVDAKATLQNPVPVPRFAAAATARLRRLQVAQQNIADLRVEWQKREHGLILDWERRLAEERVAAADRRREVEGELRDALMLREAVQYCTEQAAKARALAAEKELKMEQATANQIHQAVENERVRQRMAEAEEARAHPKRQRSATPPPSERRPSPPPRAPEPTPPPPPRYTHAEHGRRMDPNFFGTWLFV